MNIKIFQEHLKFKTIDCQKIELEESENTLQKTVIHQSLQLSNNIVRFYKIIFQNNITSNSSGKKILSS